MKNADGYARRFVRMIRRIVAVRMTRDAVACCAVVVAVASCSSLNAKLGMPSDLGRRDGGEVVGRRPRCMRQEGAERHRDSEDGT